MGSTVTKLFRKRKFIDVGIVALLLLLLLLLLLRCCCHVVVVVAAVEVAGARLLLESLVLVLQLPYDLLLQLLL